MTRRQKVPLRSLSLEERQHLEKVSRAFSEAASRVARATILLAVADGSSYTNAARRVGRRSGDAVAKLVVRFNQEGVAALNPLHGGGPTIVYECNQQERILHQVKRQPDRLHDGTATWSLSSLQRNLRATGPAFATVSTYTIHKVLKDSGWSWQKERSWCETGKVRRKCKTSVVTVVDPDAEAKKP
jgi:transposase